MKIIGIDSSGMVASVALVADGVLIAEYTMNHKKTHSQTLLPMLDQIVRDAEIELAEIDAIAVAAGPGSFTGLRIGAATVKGLALALEKPVIPVPTCEGLAYNLSNGCMYYPAGVTGEADHIIASDHCFSVIASHLRILFSLIFFSISISLPLEDSDEEISLKPHLR